MKKGGGARQGEYAERQRGVTNEGLIMWAVVFGVLALVALGLLAWNDGIDIR